ncbi:MAG: ATP cone domain-containing protein, partial [Methylococcales bacterium]
MNPTADSEVARNTEIETPNTNQQNHTPQNSAFQLTPPPHTGVMAVTKRNGRRETVDLNKIVRAITRCAEGLFAIDPMRVATRTISGLYDGASTRELDELSIRTAALLTAEEPEYGRLGAR